MEVFDCAEIIKWLNKVSRLDTYPVPKIEEIHNKLAGGKTFTELDLSHAYEQMVLDEWWYGKFIPNLSTELEPLYQLLRKNQKWKWNTEQIRAFERSKTSLQSATVLVHYDPNKKLTVSCDASPYDVGAVLSHEMSDGSERPIAFASRTLTSAEKKYSQLDKEGLAVVFAVKKFHQFLYGRHYTIYTDHKPLLGIFKGDKPIPLMVSARIQRWILTLATYEYDLMYQPGKENGNADALSRLPLKTEWSSTLVPQEVVNLVEHLNQSPLDAVKIKQWTLRDPTLAQVLKFTLQGWPSQVNDENIKPYFARKEEISAQDGCLLWGSRVVVPKKNGSRKNGRP